MSKSIISMQIITADYCQLIKSTNNSLLTYLQGIPAKKIVRQLLAMAAPFPFIIYMCLSIQTYRHMYLYVRWRRAWPSREEKEDEELPGKSPLIKSFYVACPVAGRGRNAAWSWLNYCQAFCWLCLGSASFSCPSPPSHSLYIFHFAFHFIAHGWCRQCAVMNYWLAIESVGLDV